MKQILKYLKEYKKECICAPLFKLLEASFELIVPLVMAAIIDNGITASDKLYIWKMGGVPVSYTHLDVYKRQRSGRSMRHLPE